MKILFLCAKNAGAAWMAQRIANPLLGEGDVAFGAATQPEQVDPKAAAIMRKAGADVSDTRIPALGDLGRLDFDLVITLCEKAREHGVALQELDAAGKKKNEALNSVFVGAPIHIHWPLDRLIEGMQQKRRSSEAYLKAREEIEKRVRAMLDEDYFAALKEQRRRFDQLADLMDDGLLAHDDSRIIFMVNRKAEQITGYAREEICGRDCHEVFAPGGLCGSQCRFKDSLPDTTDRQEYEILITDKQGVDKRLKMSASPFVIDESKPKGVLAVMRDMTEVEKLHLDREMRHTFHGMIGVSEAMSKIFDTIKTVAASEYSVLISGESGVGKELAARAIHAESRRSGGPFVPVNCGALPESILESELFGHVRGAFTGAIRDKKGRFELADGGTLFLDEVGELPLSFQVKLLRVLQEQSFERVGGEKRVHVDARILSATNRDLRELIAGGYFREDLYYRLCVVPITLPPLRERVESLPFLVDHILDEIKKDTGLRRLAVSHEAMDMLLRFAWPGNIRELKNALQFASIHCGEGAIKPEHLPPEVRLRVKATEATTPPVREPGRLRRRKLTRESLAAALDKTKGNRVQAAKLLDVGRATLYRFLNENPDLAAKYSYNDT